MSITKPILLGPVAALCFTSAEPAQAQDHLLGEVFTTAANFCPRGTAEANGQTFAISQHQALFSILGTTYGGDGRETFNLPDMRGRVEFGNGKGPGVPERRQGSMGGSGTTTLSVEQMPAYDQPRENSVPFVTVKKCIAIEGIYPSRN